MNLGKKILRLIYKPFCVGCGKAGDWLCNKCELKIRLSIPECYVCRHISNDWKTHKKCISKENPYTHIYVGWVYGKIARKLIALYKYRGIYSVSDKLVELLIRRLSGFWTKSLKNKTNFKDVVIICVPLHNKRLKERGFNQAELIAEKLSTELNIAFIPNLISRTKNTTKQSHLSKTERLKNLEKAFQLNSKLVKSLKSRNISKFIIVDDVITTGTTINKVGSLIKSEFSKSQLIGICLFRGLSPVKTTRSRSQN